MKRTVFEGQTYKLNCGTIATVTKYVNCGEVHIETNTGYKAIVSSSRLRNGQVQDRLQRTVCGVGYIGVGKYNTSHKSGSRWFKIMRRAYDEETAFIHPTYINCIVSDKWHNLQDFGKWFDENNVDGYHLDKDLKVPGNKVYGPETCVFIPQDINKFFKIHPYKNENLPHGICRVGVNFSIMAYSKVRETIKEALCDYWNWKFDSAKKLCNKYPEFEDLIMNYFEYYFNLLYPEYIKNKVIVDLENTLSNSKHRMFLLKKDNEKFQKEFTNDTLNVNIYLFIKQLKMFNGYDIVILTAKKIKYKDLVIKWLNKHNVKYDELIMKDGNMSDIEFKKVYTKIHKEEILFALDDVGANANMIKDEGIPCLRIEQK